MARESAVTKRWREAAQQTRHALDMYESIVRTQRRGGEAYAVESASDDYGTTTYELWCPTAAAGGIVLTVFDADGQSPVTNVQRFEDARHDAERLSGTSTHLGFRIAIERLTIARNHAYEAEAAS